MAIVILLAETSIQLVPDGTILLHIVLILVMIGVLNRTLFQPINKILADREKMGSGALAEAEELESKVRLGNKQYSDALRNARAAGYRLMEESRGEELREREVRLGSTKAEIESGLQRERAVIQNESADARAGLDSSSLATQIRDQILKPAETGRNQ